MEEKKLGKWEFCYIINKKEPKDNPSKIQCRRHEEDWKLLEGFNEECDESMQSRTNKVRKCMNCGGTGQEYIPYTSKQNAYFKPCTKCQGVGKLN